MTLHDSDLSREGSNHKEKNEATFWRRDVERRLEVAATLCGLSGG